jgi:pyruvate kinase
MIERRAKIVCTIGPSTRSPERLRELMEAGMDVARLNFSHGNHADHARLMADLRQLSRELGRPLAILQDLRGPKIRVGELEAGFVELQTGQSLVLTTEKVKGNSSRVSTSYQQLPQDVHQGDEILLNDGLLRLVVKQVGQGEVECRVVDGGILRAGAGINLPGVELSAPSLTEKDHLDLAFGMAQGVDFVALSFVRQAADIVQLKEILERAGSPIPVVAKLEKPQAIDALDDILQVADGVMVARGDLGVELSPERVPFIQKTIIRKAFRAQVPVITATQMLESMIAHPRPTRAEASDVANAVFDGTDAVMLSGETAVGQYPVEAVRMMDRIVREAERHATFTPERRRRAEQDRPLSFPDAMADAAGRVAADLKAAAIIAFTQSGFTARLISKYRPSTPIIAFTPNERVFRCLCLYWGVQPRHALFIEDTDQMIEAVDARLRREGLIREGDRLVILAGTPSTHSGTTNLMRLHLAGQRLSG